MATKTKTTPTRYRANGTPLPDVQQTPAEALPGDLVNIAGILQVTLRGANEEELEKASAHLAEQGQKMALDLAAATSERIDVFLGNVTKFSATCKQTLAEIESTRTRLKAPLLEASRDLDTRFKAWSAPLEKLRRDAQDWILRGQRELATRAAQAARDATPEGEPLQGVVVEPPAPIRTSAGTAVTTSRDVVVVDNIMLVAVARPDLVELKSTQALAELKAGAVIPGLRLGKSDTVTIR